MDNIIKIIKDKDTYTFYYLNGNPVGVKKLWSEMSVSEKVLTESYYG
jgi:hypothetical protein